MRNKNGCIVVKPEMLKKRWRDYWSGYFMYRMIGIELYNVG